jgi:hypothetical protein
LTNSFSRRRAVSTSLQGLGGTSSVVDFKGNPTSLPRLSNLPELRVQSAIGW